MAEGGEEESLVQIQRLKAALHYSIGRAYENVTRSGNAGEGITVNKEVIAAVNEMVYQQCGIVAKDLELFSKHAKRTTVTADDVLLLCRRNSSLLKIMREENEVIKAAKEKGKGKEKEGSGGVEKKKGLGPKKKKELMAIDDDDADDDLV